MGRFTAFLSELARRKVWLFGGIYLALGWIVLQVAVVIEATLKLPDWIDQSVLVLLGLGFPFALLFAWAQESQGQKTPVSTGSEPQTAQVNQPSSELSVVVLPFRATANDEIGQLTAEGLTDDITTLLTGVKGIKVAPRQAMGRRLAADDDALEIARDLGGRYALTGSVRRDGDKLRVSTELTDISEREQKWSQKFDRPADDIFAIQDEIAKGVVATLGVVISRVEAARTLRQPPDSLQAWELVQRAQAVSWDFRPETLDQAVLDLRKALELDPNYDFAHAFLAHTLGSRAIQGWSPDLAAEREEAFFEADQAVRLGFDNAQALHCAQMTMWVLGEPEKAIQIYEGAIARRPDFFLSLPIGLASIGVAYAKVGQADKGLALLKTFEDMFPDDQFGAVWTRPFKGNIELARQNYHEAAKLHANPPSEYNGMCRVIALMNIDEIEEAKAEFARLQHANPAINLDHYIEHFKGYHIDKSIGAELSDALVRLKVNL